MSSSIFTTLFVLLLITSVAESEPSTYIVGGSQTAAGDFPYFVDMNGCGGALIAPDTVLLAAHCGDSKGKQIIVGAYETASLEHGAQARFCDEWVPHPQWDDVAINNDFALCKLDEPVEIDEESVKLVLNDDPVIPAGNDDLIVMGIGALAYESSSPEFLHSVVVPAIPNDECNGPEMYGNIINITDQMLCAGAKEGGKDSCQGDSGGPIVKRVVQSDGSFLDYHVGVVSFGYECALANKPGVYARTSTAMSFIEQTVCGEFNSVASFCENSDGSSSSIATPPPVPCEAEIDVVVETDIYGSETNWSITEQDSEDELFRRTYMLSQHRNSHKVCVKKNTCYSFNITDEYGDGLCAEKDNCGFYELRIPGQEPFAKGADFAEYETTKFCIDDAGNKVDELPAQDEDSDDSECEDKSDFTMNGLRRGCKSIARKKGNKAKKICKKKRRKGKIVADFCPETCGKLGIGKCDHLKEGRKKKK